MKRLSLCFLSLIFVSQLGLASIKPVKLVLSALLPFKVSERGGDELYMDFLVYPSKGKSTHFTVPRKPLHWPSFMIKNLKDVLLWEGEVPVGESVSLQASLLEKDAPPWNRDELIGSFILVLKNKSGKLMYALREDKDDKKVFQAFPKPIPPIELTGNGAHYQMTLKLAEGSTKTKTKPK